MTIPAHSITALRYRFHLGPVDLAPLVIRQAKRFAWEQACVTAYVLGASHALTVALPDGREFTELLTCLPPRLSRENEEWSLTEPVGNALTKKIQGVNWVNGEVLLSRFPLVPGADCISAEFAPQNILHEPFSLSTGETAWTRVAWRMDGARLQIETIHTYPDDGAGIRSATSLHLLTAS